MSSYYMEILKPEWAPPSWVFGPVWFVIYTMMTISFGAVFLHAIQKKIPRIVVLPFVLNLIFNFAFTPIQFGLQNNFLAMIDILLVLVTIVWAMIWIKPYLKWVFYFQIPYLLWVSFASVLQITITYLNW